MPRYRLERKTRSPQISRACGIILIKIIDSYCTCENGKKKLIPTPNSTNCLELLDGGGRGCDLESDLVQGFPSSACLGPFIYYLRSPAPAGALVAPLLAPTDLKRIHLCLPVRIKGLPLNPFSTRNQQHKNKRRRQSTLADAALRHVCCQKACVCKCVNVRLWLSVQACESECERMSTCGIV